jgi:VCBS repeat-containing protein
MIARAKGGKAQRPTQPAVSRQALHAANTVARLLLFASLAVTLPACTDSGPKSPVAPYALTMIGTTRLPAVMYEDEGYKLEVTAGTLELADPDKYTMSMTVVETVDGNKSTYTDTESGKWALATDGSILITLATGEQVTATWHGTQLTVTRDETDFVYEMAGR